MLEASPAFQTHCTLDELATQWNVSRTTLLKIFKEEIGVIKI